MKILALIIIIAGGIITFASNKIANKFFASEDENTNIANSLKIKGIGFILVLLAAVLMYLIDY